MSKTIKVTLIENSDIYTDENGIPYLVVAGQGQFFLAKVENNSFQNLKYSRIKNELSEALIALDSFAKQHHLKIVPMPTGVTQFRDAFLKQFGFKDDGTLLAERY